LCLFHTQKKIILFLISFESSLAYFCTEELQRQTQHHDWQLSYSLELHAAVACNAVRTHIFKDAAAKDLSQLDLAVVFELTDKELLAKIVRVLADMVKPLRWCHPAGSIIAQPFTVDTPYNFDTSEDGFITQNDWQGSTEHSRGPELCVRGSPCIQHVPHSHTPYQNNTSELASDHPHKKTSKEMHANCNGRIPKTKIVTPGITDRRFEGTVLCFCPQKNFGYISCSELRARFNKDMWVHKEQLANFGIGQLVSFMVILNKQGHPQAVDLQPMTSQQFQIDDVPATQADQFLVFSL